MKKFVVAFIMLMIPVTVGYAYYNNNSLYASNSTKSTGATLTGRVNKAPSNLTGPKQTIGMKKGDRYYLGKNTVTDGNAVGWQLVTDEITSNTVQEQSWLAFTTDPLKIEPAFDYFPNYYAYDTIDTKVNVNGNPVYGAVAPFDESNISNTLNAFNTQWSADYNDLIGTYLPDKFEDTHNYLKTVFSNTNTRYLYTIVAEYKRTTTFGKNAFIPHVYDMIEYTPAMGISENRAAPAFKLTAADIKFNSKGQNYHYFSHEFYEHNSDRTLNSLTAFDGQTGNYYYTSNLITEPFAVRPAIFIQKNNMVFGLSNDSKDAGGISTVISPKLPSSYSNITTDAEGDTMKIRYHDSAMNVSLDSLLNEQGAELKKNSNGYLVTVGSKIKVKAEGNTVNSNSTVSALIFDSNGDFIGYQKLGDATGGLESYELSTSSLKKGEYQIAVVNEVYDDNDIAKSSLISDVKRLTVVDALSDLKFTAKQDLEYEKNVNVGNSVGTISSSNGIETVVYHIVEDSLYPGESADLEIGNDGKSVIVKNNALNAGTYHFKIQAQDGNGHPQPPLEIAATITVKKINATVAFDDPNQTKKSITEATAGWSETATATPSNGVKVTYEKVSGDIGLIDIDSDTGAITYKGSGAYGKVTIRATADDDPSSGSDNYNAASVTKEIVIYAEVNGSVTPHANSSDINTPTFTANDPNVKIGGTIGTIHGAPGTPDNVTSGEINYTFGLKSDGDGSYFAVNASSGDITTKANLSVGSYHITVTVSDKWSTKEIPVTINVGVAQAEDLKFYETSAAINAITTKSAKITDTNVTVYATVKGSSNPNQVTYKIKDGSTNIIEVNSTSGAVTIHGVGTVTIVAEKKGASGQADAQAELTFTVTAGAQNFIYTDNAGNELPKSGNNYSAKTDAYALNKTFQLYTAGNPPGSAVTYKLKSGSPTDVISVDSNGLVTILNASLNNQMGKVIVQATSHDPSGNYSDKTIELPINIDKGTRTIAFAEDPIYVVNGKGQVTPVIEVDGVTDTDGDILIEIDSNEDGSIAWTSDNKTIQYDYSDSNPKDIKIHATKPMDRNYKAAEADGILHIMGPDENVLAITSPGKITYGDRFTIRSSQYDADSTNVQYTFEIDDTTYISNPTVNGNSAQFDAIKYSGTNKTTITVTRTADGESPLSKKVQVIVLPKPIEIIIDDKEKYKGEQNPALTYQDFKNQLVSWNGVQDVIQANDIKLSTTVKTDSNAGSYPIKGDSNTLNKTYPNYSFSFKEGTLTIKEENIEDDWYHLEMNDGNNTAYTGNWTNQNVNIISDHSEYINLSLDQSTWKPNQVTVSKEGETNQSFWMKKASGAITKEKQEIIKIDKTAPRVKGIKAKDTNNKLQDIINKLSGGIFFQPGTAFEISTDDSNADLKVSGTKEIAYKVYKIEQQARSTDELIKDGTLTVTNEKASITISETTGSFKVCVTPSDNAGNMNTESCHEVELKKIDVDIDNDGKPDFNDPNGDGCPDLNIKWKDPNNPSKWIIINGDRDGDGIPDSNIDSDGDGKADLNVDTDHDGKPDLNLVILKKSDWKPTICVRIDIDNGILEEYCTGTAVKAAINIDTDNDGIPNLNIDNNGDMKADINISKDGITPIINIADIHKWEPLHDYKAGITYDSIGIEQEEYKRKVNIDTDGDGRPDVNVDLDNDGKPDINIDLDGDEIPDIDIDGDGDGKPDINVDLDGNGTPDENIIEIKEWKPEKNVDGELPYDTMSFDEKEEPNDPDEPSKPTEQGNKTDVKGAYYPGENVGGAITGDNTNIMLYISLCSVGIAVISYLLYRYQKDTFQ